MSAGAMAAGPGCDTCRGSGRVVYVDAATAERLATLTSVGVLTSPHVEPGRALSAPCPGCWCPTPPRPSPIPRPDTPITRAYLDGTLATEDFGELEAASVVASGLAAWAPTAHGCRVTMSARHRMAPDLVEVRAEAGALGEVTPWRAVTRAQLTGTADLRRFAADVVLDLVADLREQVALLALAGGGCA